MHDVDRGRGVGDGPEHADRTAWRQRQQQTLGKTWLSSTTSTRISWIIPHCIGKWALWAEMACDGRIVGAGR